jgi:hypothetical protein
MGAFFVRKSTTWLLFLEIFLLRTANVYAGYFTPEYDIETIGESAPTFFEIIFPIGIIVFIVWLINEYEDEIKSFFEKGLTVIYKRERNIKSNKINTNEKEINIRLLENIDYNIDSYKQNIINSFEFVDKLFNILKIEKEFDGVNCDEYFFMQYINIFKHIEEGTISPESLSEIMLFYHDNRYNNNRHNYKHMLLSEISKNIEYSQNEDIKKLRKNPDWWQKSELQRISTLYSKK